MEISKSIDAEGVLKLSIEGDLDAGSAIDMDTAMQDAYEQQQYHLLIDCKLLKYISSAGMGVFISHYDNFKTKNGSIVFADMSDRVYSVFELLGVHRIFDIKKAVT